MNIADQSTQPARKSLALPNCGILIGWATNLRLRVGETEAPAERPLRCAECGAVSEADARGWRAYLDDEGQAVTFGPECAKREFETA